MEMCRRCGNPIQPPRAPSRVGVRAGLLGNAVAIVSRYIATPAETNRILWQPDLPALCLNNALITAGVALHWRALLRHTRVTNDAMRHIGISASIEVVIGFGSGVLRAPTHRADRRHLVLVLSSP
jgi:hypothetical protein